ncbi:MAG: cysteine desulfurase [Candidatus Caldarchaeum sp.]|nr:cysteine desulfurase [Candidatus Caldarchaeum sp.]MDW8062700.1 cysteine desulfurase [Candidatus Caldarchaeum sp.]MDW8435506.1 cysteine desulfurase [Candidatus Caldarchaeum sp.]
MSLNPKLIRKDFPIFQKNDNLIYFDSAATSQKPIQVIEAVADFYRKFNANVHRGVYRLSVEATEAYEGSRRKVAQFINAANSREVVFVRNTTEALNLVAHSIGINQMKKGGKIVLTMMEHHSNIVPWQLVSKIMNHRIEYIPFDGEGYLDLSVADKILRDADVFSFVHASNVLGTVNDVKLLCRMAHDHGALAVVDAAQSVPHMPVDVRDIGCDFLAFSGHKMLGPTGIGVLYGRYELLDGMEPFMGGGEMIKEVHLDRSVWNDVPWKFEAGTPNIAGAVGLGAAVDYLRGLGMENVRTHEHMLTAKALELLAELKHVKIYGPENPKHRCGLVAFNLGDIHPHDLATYLDNHGICVRAGHHCAMPIHTRLGLSASTRASFFVYNTVEELEIFQEVLKKAVKFFKLA